MINNTNFSRKLIFNVIFAFLELKLSDIAKILHISKSVVSRHISGEKECCKIDAYLAHKLFGKKVILYIQKGGYDY